MVRRIFVVSLVSLIAVSLTAQQPAAVSAPTPDSLKPPSSTFPLDPAKTAALVRDSYYHPSQLSGLDCSVSVDWAAFFASLKTTVPPERLKAVQGLIAHVQSSPGKVPAITFDWTAGVIDSKDQMEAGLKQMIGGFYHMYWPMIASSPLKSGAEIKKIEPQPDGGNILYTANQNSTADITIDKNYVPVHYTFTAPTLSGTIDSTYTPSPNPVPGDLRRLTGIKVVDHIGNSTINVDVTLDYQSVGGFYIPQHADFAVGGAYSIKMEFSGCSVSKDVGLVPETKDAPAAK